MRIRKSEVLALKNKTKIMEKSTEIDDYGNIQKGNLTYCPDEDLDNTKNFSLKKSCFLLKSETYFSTCEV
jgi:hypothetical protein